MSRRARSDERKQQLIQAAGQSIAELGLSALTIRKIAARAGISPGLVLYHYPETDALVYDVHSALVDRYLDQRMQALAKVADPPRRLVRAFESGLPSGPDDEVCRLLFELHGLATRSTQHAALMTSLWDREVMLYQGIIETGLAFEKFTTDRTAREVAASLLAMEDGLALHIVSANSSVSVDFAVRNLAAAAGAMLSHDFLQYV